MALFGNGVEQRKRRHEAIKGEHPTETVFGEELAELAAKRDPREVDQAVSEADAAVDQATRDELRDIKVLEQGRCPECKSRTENFLYTVLCPTCGWYRRSVPDCGRSVVYLNNDREIQCDYVHTTTDGDFLCIRDGVVISQVMRRQVNRIDYNWEPGELDSARERLRTRKAGLCSWCEKDLSELAENESTLTDYVAFGAVQERHIFCSEKCMREFRKQYASRVHRNCYETDCNDCNQCIKRYDVDGFRRMILR